MATIDLGPSPPGPRDHVSTGGGGLADLMTALRGAGSRVLVQRTAPSRYVVLLGASAVSDLVAYRLAAVRTIESALDGDDAARVLLVGAGHGGVLAAELAAAPLSVAFTIDGVVTAGSPSAHGQRIPDGVRVLSLEDRDDPVALLGSLVNAGAANRTDVVFDASGAAPGEAHVAGARAADEAAVHHPDLGAELDRLRAWGYLAR